MPAEAAAMLSTPWVYTLISCSVRQISMLLLIIPGYFFIVVAPARRCPTAGQSQCPRYVLNMSAKGYPIVIRFILSCPILCPDMCPHIHGTTAVSLSVMLSCLSCQKECTNIQALSESPLEVCILTRRVGTLCPGFHCLWALVECEL